MALGAWLTTRDVETRFVTTGQKYAIDSVTRDNMGWGFVQPCVTKGVASLALHGFNWCFFFVNTTLFDLRKSLSHYRERTNRSEVLSTVESTRALMKWTLSNYKMYT